MPELGKYAVAVLGSYGLTVALLALIVLVSLKRARKVRASLDEVERWSGKNG